MNRNSEEIRHLWFHVKSEKQKNFEISTLCFLTFDFDYFFSNEYLSKDLEQIPIEERFIYKYLKDKRAKEAEKPASDDESVTSEDFNAAMKSEMDRDMDFAGNLQDAGDENDENSDEDAGKIKNYVKSTWHSVKISWIFYHSDSQLNTFRGSEFWYFVNFCTFWRLKVPKMAKFIALKIAKNGIFWTSTASIIDFT